MDATSSGDAPDAEYDLVIFALVDSLVLHSGYSNLRLESFLFTAESFRDVRRVLKPGGVAAVYNFFRQGWIAVRLNEVLKSAFGGEPVVLTDPPRDEITMEQFDAGMFTLFLAGSKDVTAPVSAAFARVGVVLAAQRPAARPGRARPVRRGRTATPTGHRRGHFHPQGPAREWLGAPAHRDGGARAGRPSPAD